MFILILIVFSQRAFEKWRQSVCALARDFLHGAGSHGEEFALACF
jgi:hypothetical protein